MDATQFHPSPYYKSADFLAGPRVLTIQSCGMVTFDNNEQKPALSFAGDSKQLPLNKTNTAMLISLFGGETDNWAGKAIECYTEKVPMQGRIVDSIKLRLPQQAAPAAQETPAPDAPPTVWGQ
jgi:hypothetical protein